MLDFTRNTRCPPDFSWRLPDVLWHFMIFFRISGLTLSDMTGSALFYFVRIKGENKEM
ncbi:hypothetical protein MITSMUL_03613 [Mitsuokella multacida DSM 20544]|uniref:Uncharacterized protein n=1 Tax=Mitsuokella multacida DSM 20544 TaxID=500635 RepID=C9KKB4_9FIRM|nr:hypothetical protein MITSMUL_03613 [Mitsuokella multacida DSM 20544]